MKTRYFKDNKDSDLQKVIFNVNGSYAFDIFRKVINNNGSLNNLKLNKILYILCYHFGSRHMFAQLILG